MNIGYQILEEFESIDLKEMDSVKLMNRTDTKFLFTVNQFNDVMKNVKDQYRVLEINGQRLNQYRTLYYDTEKLHLYTQHHKGKLNRYKIRHRTYVESETGFIEVKFKNNKGRTIKKRIKERLPPNIWEGENKSFLTKVQPYDPSTLIPAIWVNYCRYTLVHKTELERLTIDLNLEFVKGEITKKMDGLVIAEIKQEKRKATAFMKMMKKYHIREGSISKYCMAIALTTNGIKKNNFKTKLLTLNHIMKYATVTNS